MWNVYRIPRTLKTLSDFAQTLPSLPSKTLLGYHFFQEAEAILHELSLPLFNFQNYVPTFLSSFSPALEEDTSLPSRANSSTLSLMCLMGIISFLFCARNIHSTSDSELKDLGFALRSGSGGDGRANVITTQWGLHKEDWKLKRTTKQNQIIKQKTSQQWESNADFLSFHLITPKDKTT